MTSNTPDRARHPRPTLDTHNPFTAPEHVFDEELPDWSDAERTRNKYIGHESAVKAVGGIYFFVGSLLAMAGLSGRSNFALFVAGLLFLPVGFGLWRLKHTARIFAALLWPSV